MRIVVTAVLPPVILFATSFAAAQSPSTPLPPLPPPSAEPAPDQPPTAVAAPRPAPPPAAAPVPEPALAPAPAAIALSEAPRPTRRPARDSFYLRLSLGPAFLSSTGDGPAGPTSINGSGFALAAALGGAIEKGLALAATFRVAAAGGTLNGYASYSSGFSSMGQPISTATAVSTPGASAVVQLGVLADWYPVPSNGWHAGASLALSAFAMGAADSNQTLAGTSTGGSLFGGYDWWLGGKWALGLMAVAGTMGRSSLQDSNRNNTGYSMMPFFFALEGSVLFF